MGRLLDPQNRFDLSEIMNLDETPIPFEYLDGHTYDFCGAKTVSGKSDRSGWDKRQATVILYIFADGVSRIPPKLIFHGTAGPNGQIFKQEGHLYSGGVTVEFNETAYNNQGLFQKWIVEELVPLVRRDFLLVMDVAAFHKTPEILDLLRRSSVTTALIPSGCTSLVQPLDTSVNKPFKQWLREATDDYIANLDPEPEVKWTTSARRIMTTHVVAAAWQRLCERSQLVKKAFTDCGISVSPSGHDDHLINIKDIPSSSIDFTGWQQAPDPSIRESETAHVELDPAADVTEEHLLQGEDVVRPNIYRTLLWRQLKDLCKERNLQLSGIKSTLIERLEADDERLMQLSAQSLAAVEASSAVL